MKKIKSSFANIKQIRNSLEYKQILITEIPFELSKYQNSKISIKMLLLIY